MNPDHSHSLSCCSPTAEKQKWFLNKNILATAVLFLFLSVSFFFPALSSLHQNLWMYIRMIWWAILFGFLLGGLLDRYIPKEYIAAVLARKEKKSVFYAVMLGFLMSSCSHGMLALSMGLHKKGASTSVVIAFLLASPWANLPITLMLLSFFGLKALYIILGALVIAFNTGVLFQFLEKKGIIEANPNTYVLDENYSIVKDIQKRIQTARFSLSTLPEDVKVISKGALALADMTFWMVVIGVLLSSLSAAFIPESLFKQYMGPTLLGLLATLAFAAAMEVCSQGTAPLAFEIFKKTGAFGNAFVFLMAGVVTNLTAIGLVWANIGRKAALWIPIVALPQVIVLGILANHLF